jgi:metallo-beta-lactamase class B
MTRRWSMACICWLAGTLAVQAQTPAPATPDNLVVAAKRAAGTDYAGTFVRICVAPENLGGGAARGGGAGARVVPDRAQWYAPPYRVFDNLYFVGTKIHSAWALTTSDGIIIIDTLFDYAIEPEIIDGLSKLGLDPRAIKYVLISHAHGDHDQGAALLQRRGAKVVMGAADWEATLQRPTTAAGGVPTRDIAVGPEGLKLRLGDTLVDVVATPGHTPGTLSYVFPVKDRGRSLVVAYSGGTAFNFPRRPENFAVYRDTQRKMIEVAGAAGATVLMTNHTEFDRAYDRARLAQLPRAAGEKHPYETDAATVQRYFEMARDCAEAQRLSIK